jgi:hypothetical protein
LLTPITNITNEYPKQVPVLVGAARMLVAQRELRGDYVKDGQLIARKRKSESYYEKRKGGYQTNRDIKAWSCFFLLKALTTSGHISEWTKQKDTLLTWVQCNENTFRRLLARLKELELCTINQSRHISLTSYEKAAAILGIEYNGTFNIKYNLDAQQGKQIFQFLLRGEEFRSEQQRQLEALMYYLNKNPNLKNDLTLMLLKFGADDKLLHNAAYFQQRLLMLQIQSFKNGSDLLSYIFSRRADINRSCNRIAEHHNYKHAQSVSYLKKRMAFLKLIAVQKILQESVTRSRLFIVDGHDKPIDAYKWLGKKKTTALVLTDQITFNYDIQLPQKATAKKAA